MPSPDLLPRAPALDALRGISILMMVFSGRIPFGVLPDWMYHAQVPPPDHVFNPNLPGITWVDLVFPFFLFSMGAAIPLALRRRIDKGVSPMKLVGGILLRGILLAAFSIYVMHIRPWGMQSIDWKSWLLCLVGFILLFPMLGRLPEFWTKRLQLLVRAGGWLGAAAVMSLVRYADGSGFSVYRSDIIILVLANVAVFGGLIWLCTPENLLHRFAFLVLLLALRLGGSTEGWVHAVMAYSPIPWLFQMNFLKYLFIVIPGTVVGDAIYSWMKTSVETSTSSASEPRWRDTILLNLTLILQVMVVIGLKARWSLETALLSFGICSAALYLVSNPHTSLGRLHRTVLLWGSFWIFVGMFLEPFEGGIKKDHSTLSYYAVTSGLAMFALVGFSIIMDAWKVRRGFRLLISSGQNPLVAYAGVNSLVPPILGLSGLDVVIERVTPTPWLGALRGAFMTYLVALSASLCTRWKVFLRT